MMGRRSELVLSSSNIVLKGGDALSDRVFTSPEEDIEELGQGWHGPNVVIWAGLQSQLHGEPKQ